MSNPVGQCVYVVIRLRCQPPFIVNTDNKHSKTRSDHRERWRLMVSSKDQLGSTFKSNSTRAQILGGRGRLILSSCRR